MKKRNVLVFPAGTEIGLEIFHALKDCKEVNLYGAGQDIPNHARFIYSQYHILPAIYEKNWFDSLLELCSSLAIDYIFPAYDDVLVALIRQQELLPASVITSPLETCELTRSKSQTYRYFKDRIRVPRLYNSPESVTRYPVLVKPDRGQGSLGVRRVDNASQLFTAISTVKDAIICEYLPGEEYTVDCFSDRDLGLLFAGARSRRKMRNGISVNTISCQQSEITGIAELISGELDIRGGWFFQLKRAENGELALLEVAPRIAGSMALHRVMGINFPLLSIFEHERLPLTILANPGEIEMDRALSNRFRHKISFNNVYMGFDETLLCKGKVNTMLIKLIYQCIDSEKQIKLVTRHKGDLEQILLRHRLSGLFDEVLHVQKGQPKSEYITEKDAIFIDSSFSDRLEVANACGIPTFDCSMIELLTV